MAISFASLASGKTQKTEIIKSTQSWTAPTGVTSVEVILCGGGGGAGGGGGTPTGGGGGSVDYTVLTVTPGTSYTITIGAGGSAVLGNNTGTTGGSSSFGSLYTVNGGPGSGPWTYGVGVRLGGGGGQCAYNTSAPLVTLGMPGAFGFGGGGGGGAAGDGQQGGATNGGGYGGCNSSGYAGAANTGGGGGGTRNSSTNTANGGSGVCIIKYWS